MQTVLQFLQFLCRDMNPSLKPAFILLRTIATSEEGRKLNALGSLNQLNYTFRSSMKSPNSMILVISEFLNARQYIFETSIVIILDSGMRMI